MQSDNAKVRTLTFEGESDLRDEFAMAAITAVTMRFGRAMSAANVASDAYLIADAMLKERKK